MKIKSVSVARKIIIYFILSSFVISITGMTFSLFRDVVEYQKEIKKRFKMINKSHMPSLATSLYTENLPQIRNLISGILSVQDMVYLEVTLDDEDGKVVYKGGVKGDKNDQLMVTGKNFVKYFILGLVFFILGLFLSLAI